jgi:hypothetical protein
MDFLKHHYRIKRIALVGCDTDGVSQGLTRDFARIAYNDIPALQHTEITGRTGQVQVNDDGTKTMTTDGTPFWSNLTIILVSGCLLNKALAASTTVELLLF